MHSHHSHSGQFCRHAKDDLEDVVKRAIELGFSTFGLSEHAPRYRIEDLFPEEADLKPEELERIYFDFLSTAKDLQAKYRDQIDLLIGIETDYVTQLDLDRTRSLLDSQQDIQYVVGSVHHVQGVSIDFDKSSFLRAVEHCNDNTTGSTMALSSSSKLEMPGPRDPDFVPTDAQMNVFLERYLDAQYEMILHLEPEVIGHFDLCLLFNPAHKIHGADRWGVYKKVLRNIKAVVEYGGLFEANSAAFRKGWETSYPTKEILGMICDSGGKICLSDDSHGVSQVGLNYDRLRDYLVRTGVEEIYYLVDFKDRKPGDEDVGSRGRVVARMVSDWDDNPFWKSLLEKRRIGE